jgi:protein TIF31
MNKVLNDFGEASVLGVKAICDGQIAPMNPNESTRSQVYLHNNIFFSRAVDAGVETFKIAKGDKAARKSASRDVHCLGALHRMERSGLYTLATVLVDYLGTRYVCQSILPGILSGEKTHTLLYGAVEAGSPLMWDKEMHELLENTLGKSLMIATRPLPREPLSEERAAEIQAVKIASPLYIEKKDDEEKKDEEAGQTISVCAPIEAKGIRGSDQRKYVLDMTRLTPRDANWVTQENGGTGNWESLLKPNGSSKAQAKIPKDLDDDEWTLAVLRPELVTNYAQVCMARYLAEKKQKESQKEEALKDSNATADGQKAEGKDKTIESSPNDNAEKESGAQGDDDKKEGEKASTEEGDAEKKPPKKSLTEEDLDYLKSLRFNVNIFLPDLKSLEGIDDSAFKQIKEDEEMGRSAAKFLWGEALPRITRDIREGSGHQIPHDGRSLTEFIHQHGVNCRYLGRLATLAQMQEEKDRNQMEEFKQNKTSKLDRRTMPLFWLELIECEIVARAAKHVLDRYLTENGGNAAFNPSQTVASFLCALISEGEETAAQTENRMGKLGEGKPDEDDFNALTLFDVGGDGDAVPAPIRGRYEVWSDIEKEVGRRFRYHLTLFNRSSKKDRTLYIPLLRRVCQRTGVRLAAKSYEIGGKCLSSGAGSGGQMTASHPISPLDVIDIVPLMKHSAAHGEGFVPCGLGPSSGLPALHISLPDARAALEAAHLHHSGRSLSRALDLAQEACGLYQRVTETPAHPGVVRCIDLMATILFDAGEPALAAGNAVKALGLLVQIGGFDSPDVIGAHLVIFQMLLTAGQLSKAIKHLKAAIYLMEVLGGPHHVELSNAYHKVGTVYHGINDLATALRFYQEAASRESCDRLLEGMISKSTAIVMASIGEYKAALENEKHAFQLFSILLGENHSLTKTSDQTLKKFMSAAVVHGNKMVEDSKKKKEEDAAEAIAHEIEVEEAAEEGKKKKKNNKKKKGKK